MRTAADRTGRKVLGTLNNCGGGATGWGTLLTAEENFDRYFANNDALPEGPQKALNGRFGIPAEASGRKWERLHPRFDGRWAVYSGDDSRFEFVYKFVTRDAVRPGGYAANRDLLDQGTLYVARFDDDGTGEWLPLVFGTGPLTRANGFQSQADVLIRARDAGTALGPRRWTAPRTSSRTRWWAVSTSR